MSATLADAVEMIKRGAPHLIHSDEELTEYTDALLGLTSKLDPSLEEVEAMGLLTLLIEHYQSESCAATDAGPVDVLRLLLKQNGLSQRDIAGELGGESTVSLVLSGKRQLNRHHIARLSRRFHVSPSVFFGKSQEQPLRSRSENRDPRYRPLARVGVSSTARLGHDHEGCAIAMPRLRSMSEGPTTEQKHDRFLAAAESSLDDFYIFDGVPDASGTIVDFRFSYINPNAERRLTVRRETLLGKILTEVRPFMISSGLIEKYREVVRTGIPFTCEVYLDDEMIKGTWLNVQVVKLGDGIAITSRDVTEHRRNADRVSYLAHYDQLTGLPNRTLLQDRLQQAILRAQRHNHKVAVFILDVDRFKGINDSLGHAGGDAVLAAVGKRLLSVVRETDTIARVGGDEFVILMPDFKSLEDLEHCGSQIVRSTARPIAIGNREINVTLSVGLCVYPDCGLDVDQLLRNADAAMYAVKETGRNGFHIFRKSLLKEDGEVESNPYR